MLPGACSLGSEQVFLGKRKVICHIALPRSLCALFPTRGTTAVDGAGFGIDRPAELTKEDDEYEAFRKRMMLAYRFRPNPLVSASETRADPVTNPLRLLCVSWKGGSVSSALPRERMLGKFLFDSVLMLNQIIAAKTSMDAPFSLL